VHHCPTETVCYVVCVSAFSEKRCWLLKKKVVGVHLIMVLLEFSAVFFFVEISSAPSAHIVVTYK
jgi:hypothetical protein